MPTNKTTFKVITEEVDGKTINKVERTREVIMPEVQIFDSDYLEIRKPQIEGMIESLQTELEEINELLTEFNKK